MNDKWGEGDITLTTDPNVDTHMLCNENKNP